MALDKIFRFASTHVFESEGAGKICSELCGAASKINPVSTLKKFIPYCTQNIENILEGELQYMYMSCDYHVIFLDGEQVDSDNIDIELLWNLQLLSHVGFRWVWLDGCGFLKVVGSDGDALLIYSDSLIRCMTICVKQIKNKRAAKHVSKVFIFFVDSFLILFFKTPFF